MSKVTVYVIAYNEAEKIEEALASVAWADEIIVADSHSRDGTAELARKYTDRVIQLDFSGFGKLRNDAIGHASHEWIFSLDADERCTSQVRDEIRAIINDPQARDAYLVPRRNFFMGRWIRYSGWYPNYRQPQLFRKGKMHYTDDAVHEGFELDGSLGELKHAIWQKPFRNLSQTIEKMDRYSSLGAEKLTKAGKRTTMLGALLHGLNAFLRLYIVRLGFLDGWAGFVIALGNFEGTFYRYAKLAERSGAWRSAPPKDGDGAP